MSPPHFLDIADFQYRAQAYVRSKGRRGPDVDDITSEMVLEAIEHPDKMLSLDYVYLHALDKLDPRRKENGTPVGRASQFRRSLDGYAFAATKVAQAPEEHPAGPCMDFLKAAPASGRLRAILLLHNLHGYTMKEVGFLFGLTEARISQILTEAKQAKQDWEDANPHRWDLRLELDWIAL